MSLKFNASLPLKVSTILFSFALDGEALPAISDPSKLTIRPYFHSQFLIGPLLTITFSKVSFAWCYSRWRWAIARPGIDRRCATSTLMIKPTTVGARARPKPQRPWLQTAPTYSLGTLLSHPGPQNWNYCSLSKQSRYRGDEIRSSHCESYSWLSLHDCTAYKRTRTKSTQPGGIPLIDCSPRPLLISYFLPL